jgi:PIN domain-containing protein
VRFFFDNCIAPAIADAIGVLSEKVGDQTTHLRRRFDADAKDEVWLPELAHEGDWIVISGDTRIIRTPHLKKVWIAGGLTTFFMVDEFASKKFWVQAEIVVRWWPDIRDFAKRVAAGAGFKVPLKGKQMQQVKF